MLLVLVYICYLFELNYELQVYGIVLFVFIVLVNVINDYNIFINNQVEIEEKLSQDKEYWNKHI